MSEKNDSKGVVPPWLVCFIILVIALVVVMLASYVSEFGFARSGKQDVWGQFGDFFGGVLNPILSSLALAAVIVTMRMQSAELKATQAENKLANQHLEKQVEYIKTQNFESVFFRLYEAFLSSRDSLEHVENEVELSGQAALKAIVVNTAISLLGLANLDVPENIRLSTFRLRYAAKTNDTVSVYCRSLCQVLKYVDTYSGFDVPPDIPEGDATSRNRKVLVRRAEVKAYRPAYHSKRQYVNMIRARLTQAERKILFMACFTDEGAGLRFFVEKYSLLKGIVLPNAFTKTVVDQLYSDLAFADYEEINIYRLMLLDANQERMSQRKALQLSRTKSGSEVKP